MRIMKSKATDPTYHVIQDVKRDWKRSTEIIEKKIKKIMLDSEPIMNLQHQRQWLE